MPGETTLRYAWVDDTQTFLGLREPWDLLGRSAIETIFLTHLWLADWLDELAPDAQPRVLTAWDGNRLVGAFPLFATARARGGRSWSIMGSGTLTPNHLDVIAEKAVAEQVRSAFSAMLLERASEWDVLDLDKLPEDTPTAKEFVATFEGTGMSVSLAHSASCPYCDLPPTYDDYVASRSTRVRKKFRQTLRRFRDEGTSAAFELATDEASALRALDALVEIHQARWKGKGYAGAFADPAVVRFHRRVILDALAAGQLRIFALRDGKRIVGVSYDFHVGDTIQAYLSSFDASASRWSPGVLMRTFVIEQAIAENAARFDFLEGTEGYKSDWCESQRENLRLRVFSRTIGGRAAHASFATYSAVKKLVRELLPPQTRERIRKMISSRAAKGDDQK